MALRPVAHMEIQHIMERIQVTDDLESLLPGDRLQGMPRVRHDQDIGDAMALMMRHRLASLPVMRRRRLVGLVTRERILQALHGAESTAPPAAARRSLGLLGNGSG